MIDLVAGLIEALKPMIENGVNIGLSALVERKAEAIKAELTRLGVEITPNIDEEVMRKLNLILFGDRK